MLRTMDKFTEVMENCGAAAVDDQREPGSDGMS